MLGCKSLEHGGFHDPLQPVQPEDVSGKQVVLDHAPIDGTERRNNRMVAAVDQSLSLRGFAAGEIRSALGFDHVPGDTQGDLTVDPTVTASLLRVVELDCDLGKPALDAGTRDRARR